MDAAGGGGGGASTDQERQYRDLGAMQSPSVKYIASFSVSPLSPDAPVFKVVVADVHD